METFRHVQHVRVYGACAWRVRVTRQQPTVNSSTAQGGRVIAPARCARRPSPPAPRRAVRAPSSSGPHVSPLHAPARAPRQLKAAGRARGGAGCIIVVSRSSFVAVTEAPSRPAPSVACLSPSACLNERPTVPSPLPLPVDGTSVRPMGRTLVRAFPP